MDEQETISVNVETGERSDDKPTFNIIEHEDGQKYISIEQVGDYKEHQTAEYKAVQDELDQVLAEIDAIDQINAIEERQRVMREFVEKHGDDYDMSEFIDFSNENEFNKFMTYLETVKGRTYADPSPLLGYSRKAPQGNTPQRQYENGRKMARQVIEGRR